MARLFKRPDGKSYVAQFQNVDGKWIKRSTGCTDRRAAETVLARFEREAQQRSGAAASSGDGAVSHPPGLPTHQAHTIDGALACLLDTSIANGRADGTVTMYGQKAGHLVRVLGHALDVNSLTLDLVQSYVRDRRREGAALSTVNKDLITLRAALNLARSRGLYHGTVDDVIPALNVRYEPRERYLADEAELHRLCAELQPHRQLWVAVAIYSGARLSEVSKLDWSDVRWTSSPVSVLIRGKKTAKSKREIPLATELVKLLWGVRQPSGPIVGAWPNCRRDLAEACKRAGIARVSPNDLRRTFASWLKQRGVDSAVVARLLGHTSTKMVDAVYGRLDLATLGAAVGLFGAAPHNGTYTGHTPAVSADTTDNSAQLTAPETPSVRLETLVPRDGVEPPTRGFSIFASNAASATGNVWTNARKSARCDTFVTALSGLRREAPPLPSATPARRTHRIKVVPDGS